MSVMSNFSALGFANVKLPCFVTTPYEENPGFYGRDEVLKDIHQTLHPQDVPNQADTSSSKRIQQSYSICGLGGMGKTQIALHYVFNHKDDYPIVLWAHADTRAKLNESYARFASELGLEVIGSGDESIIKAVKDFLEQTGKISSQEE